MSFCAPWGCALARSISWGMCRKGGVQWRQMLFFIPCHLEHTTYVPQCEAFMEKCYAGEEISTARHRPAHYRRLPFLRRKNQNVGICLPKDNFRRPRMLLLLVAGRTIFSAFNHCHGVSQAQVTASNQCLQEANATARQSQLSCRTEGLKHENIESPASLRQVFNG